MYGCVVMCASATEDYRRQNKNSNVFLHHLLHISQLIDRNSEYTGITHVNNLFDRITLNNSNFITKFFSSNSCVVAHNVKVHFKGQPLHISRLLTRCCQCSAQKDLKTWMNKLRNGMCSRIKYVTNQIRNINGEWCEVYHKVSEWKTQV